MKIWLRALFTASMLIAFSSLPIAAVMLDEVKGKQIKSERGEKLGTIQQVFLGAEEQIQAVTVEKEGFFGLGGEQNLIPWVDLKLAEDQSHFIHSPGARQQEQQVAQISGAPSSAPQAGQAQPDSRPNDQVVTAQQEQRQEKLQKSQSVFLLTEIGPVKADELIGRELAGRDGETLGIVEMSYLSEDQSSVIYLIVQGEDTSLHPVPAELVWIDQQGELQVRIDKDSFNRSPRFSRDETPELGRQQWSRDIDEHFGIAPGWQQEEDTDTPKRQEAMPSPPKIKAEQHNRP